MNAAIRCVLLLVALMVSGCATTPGFKDKAQRDAALANFRSGQAQLTCVNMGGCLWDWVNAKQAANRLMQGQRWEDLADVVLAANFDQDLAWFYLGLAASGLNDNTAARVYLDRSIQRTALGGVQACHEDLCDGINLPTDARTMMANLPIDSPTRAPRAARASRPRTAAPVRSAAPSTGWVAPVDGTQPAATPARSTSPAPASGWVAPVGSP